MKEEKNSLSIYQKYMELIYYTNDLLKKYPKSETFTTVSEIKSTLYKGLNLMIYGLKTSKNYDKLKYLNELDIILNILKVHIRLSYRYKYITAQNYNTWSEMITNICNMLGGWINCLKK